MKKITINFIIASFLILVNNVNLFAQGISFISNSNQGCPPFAVTFTNTSTDGNAYRYEWHFSDGSPMFVDTLPTTVTHIFTNSGNFGVYVNVYNSTGGYINYAYNNNGNIQVNGISINAPDTVCANDLVSFCANGGQVNSASWNFGDGGTSNQTCTTHAFATGTSHNVTLTVTGGPCGNQIITKTIYISTAAYPHPSAWANNSNSCTTSPVTFNTGTYASYSWYFGDGNTSALQNPQHQYTSNGIKNIILTVTNGCNNSGTATTTVNISPNPAFPNYPNFNLQSPSSSCPNSNVGFNAPGGYTIYQWNFGDSSPLVTTNNNNNNHFYGNTTGTYTASVKIISPCGNDTTLYSTIIISSLAPFPNQSWFKLESNPHTSCPNDNINFNAPGGYSNYQWTFGDGSTSTTTDNYNHHIYTNAFSHYTVSLKIINGCGHDTTLYDTVHISNTGGFPNQSLQLYVNSPSCPNANIGIQAPNGFSKYIWNFGDSSPLVTTTNNYYNHTYGSALQNYTISVIITNGCGHDTTLYDTLKIKSNVRFPNSSDFKVDEGPNPACPNDQANFNAPYGYLNYFWKFGDGDSISSSQNNAHHIYTTAGTYTYFVKITNACAHDTTLYGTIVVGSTGSFYSGLNIQTNPSTSSCPNDLIHFTLNQNGFHSYFWNFGDGDTVTTNGEDIQHAFNTLGLFNVSCKVSNGCGNTVTIYSTVQVTSNSPVSDNLSVSGIQNPSCPGDKVFFLLHNGQSTTKYIWNYGDSTPADTTIGAGANHIYSTPGNKTVTVTAINGCGMTKTITMTQTVSTTIVPTLIGQDGKRNWGYPGGDGNNTTAGCAGDAIIFYFAGAAANNVWNFGDGNSGTATEHMLVDGGDGAFPVTIIKHVFANNGPYMIHLTITNNCGNSVTDSMLINVGGNQIVNGQLMTSPPPFTTCASINFFAFGGATYAWNFGDGATLTSNSPTASHTFSSQGIYVVTVLITNGCGNTATYSKSVNVNGAGGPAITLTSSASPTCVGGNNGSAIISVANGMAPYTYSWNDPNSQTTDTVNNLAPGIYYATVTDNIGCASTLAVSISNPAPIVLAASSTQSACGSATGTASISVVSGGVNPMSYLWSNGGTTDTISALAHGLYTVTVTDLHGCHASSHVSVSDVNTAAITLNSISDGTCYGSTNGSIDINITGGTPPYLYSWSNNATTQDLSNLAAGSYSVTVTDNSNCVAIYNAIVGQVDSLSITTSTAIAPTCGNFDGKASATVTGGTAPYTYLWDANANNQTTQTATGLPAGTYSVTVTDAHGCSKSGEISLSNSNAPNISAVVTDVSCFNGSNGSIDITVTGGTSPYLYTWNVGPPQTNHQDLNTLIPGNYLVFVNDAQGCTSVRSYEIKQPVLLTAIVTTTGATCNQNDGTALASPAGGTSPYSYLWTGGGQTNQTATGLALGSYTVTVTDNKGCITNDSAAIAQTTPIPSICMVTVDDSSVNNIVYWDKTSYTSVDSFIVYREVSTAIYKRIGAVAYNSLSEFVDTSRSVGPANGDPNVTAYGYKLQIRDACGNYSALSPYHHTIFIAGPDQNGIFNLGFPYAIEGGLNPVLNYNLICDTAGLNNWFNVGIAAGNVSLVKDLNYLSHLNSPQWRVKTDWAITCDPTRAPINTTRSNIRHPSTINGILSIATLDASVIIYPNPAKDNVTIELSALTKNAQLKIVNVLGQTVFNETIIASSNKTVKQINTSNFAKGVYTVILETPTGKLLKKLVIN